MNKNNKIPKDINDYISNFPPEIQNKLQEIRNTISKYAPNAIEAISYQMPTFKLNGNLVYFAVFKNHIGFYPTSSGIKAFEREISSYLHSKGTIKFPFDKPLPIDLIKNIVLFRVKENLNKSVKTKQKR